MMGVTNRRILFDNCVPKRLAAAIDGHSVTTVSDLGWAALKDGELLERMAGRYDALVTVDRGMRHQQRLKHRPFSIVVLRARTNRYADLLPLLPILLDTLHDMKAGRVYEIGVATART